MGKIVMRFILCCADTEVNIFKKSILVINILANGSYFLLILQCLSIVVIIIAIIIRKLVFVKRWYHVIPIYCLFYCFIKKRKSILITMGINQCSAKAKMNNTVCRDWRTDIIPDEMSYLWRTDRRRSSLNHVFHEWH